MKKILFIDGTEGFFPQRLEIMPTGGIITSLTIIPQILAKRGFDVYVLSGHMKEEKYNGVFYINKAYNIDPDVVVYNRNAMNRGIVDNFNCKKIWWLHDIVDHRYMEDSSYRDMDAIVALSKYCQDCYSDYYDIPKSKFTIIPNGVDKKIFNKGYEKDRNLFLIVSAPVKGHYPVEFTYLNLIRHNPNLDFRVYSSQALHNLDDSDSTKKMFERYNKLGIKVLPPVTQPELAELFKRARALLMPNHYPEICSNVLLQAQSCGCPVIASNIGSAGEFIEHGRTGMLTHTAPHDMFWWWKDFAEQVVKVQIDDELFKHISLNSSLNVFDWGYIATQWEILLEKLTKRG